MGSHCTSWSHLIEYWFWNSLISSFWFSPTLLFSFFRFIIFSSCCLLFSNIDIFSFEDRAEEILWPFCYIGWILFGYWIIGKLSFTFAPYDICELLITLVKFSSTHFFLSVGFRLFWTIDFGLFSIVSGCFLIEFGFGELTFGLIFGVIAYSIKLSIEVFESL